jgi:hypothetical protein
MSHRRQRQDVREVPAFQSIGVQADEALQHRLANIESVLRQLLEILQKKRIKRAKRSRLAAQSVYQSVVASGFEPTEEERRVARQLIARAQKR